MNSLASNLKIIYLFPERKKMEMHLTENLQVCQRLVNVHVGVYKICPFPDSLQVQNEIARFSFNSEISIERWDPFHEQFRKGFIAAFKFFFIGELRLQFSRTFSRANVFFLSPLSGCKQTDGKLFWFQKLEIEDEAVFLRLCM